MAVEETGSLMGVDIQSAADDVLEKWMEVVCSVAEMRPLLRLSAYRSGLFYEGKQWRCSIPQACLVFLSREILSVFLLRTEFGGLLCGRYPSEKLNPTAGRFADVLV